MSAGLGIVYLTDGNRDDLTYASIAALAMHHERSLDIHVVQAGFRALPPSSLLRWVQGMGHRLATHYLPAGRQHGRPGWGHITATAFAKVEAIEAVAGAYDHVCYLDNDMLTMRPVDLRRAAPRHLPLAAVPDLSVSTGLDNPAFFRNCETHGLPRRYFNSGFLSIDVARWRDRSMAARYHAAVENHKAFCPYWDGPCQDLDQCALNLAAGGDWETLPIGFNVQKSAFQTCHWQRALIRHYTGPEKFLPVKPHRADGLEHSLLRRIATVVPELSVEMPPRIFILAYLANGFRRRRARQRISHLISQHLQV